jgi:TonB family protein
MSPRTPLVIALAALLAALPAAGAKAPMRRPMPARPALALCDPLPGQAFDSAPSAVSTVGLNFTSTDLASARDGSVGVCVTVDSLGVVREARVVRAFAPFDSAALESVRWWRFAPARSGGRAVTARVTVEVPVRVPRDADPLSPDLLAMAQQAEANGNVREALDAWTGALARVGRHPSLNNEWAMRTHVLRLARRLPRPPEVPAYANAEGRAALHLMQRNSARAINADCEARLSNALRMAPWYAEAYRWRSSARAAAGDREGAWRDALCVAVATPDSAGVTLSETALRMYAVGDTLAAHMLLKR